MTLPFNMDITNIKTSSIPSMCVLVEDEIYSSDYGGRPENKIGVTIRKYDEAVAISTEAIEKTSKYYDLCVQNGLIIPPKTQEDIIKEQSDIILEMRGLIKELRGQNVKGCNNNGGEYSKGSCAVSKRMDEDTTGQTDAILRPGDEHLQPKSKPGGSTKKSKR